MIALENMSDYSTDDQFFSMSSSSSTESLSKVPSNKTMYQIVPDGKLATICTMVMVFSCVISIMIYNDDTVQHQIHDAIKSSENVMDKETKHGRLLTDRDIKEIVAKNTRAPMFTVPVMCTLIQAASLYIFMNAKVCKHFFLL